MEDECAMSSNAGLCTNACTVEQFYVVDTVCNDKHKGKEIRGAPR